MRISDWSSDVCSSDLTNGQKRAGASHRLLLAKTAEICFKFGHIECFPESRSPPMAETDTRQAPARGPVPATGNGRHRWRFFRAGGFDQVRIASGADLWALAGLDWASAADGTGGLDPTHWLAVRGRSDERRVRKK